MSMFCNRHAPHRCEEISLGLYPNKDYWEIVNNNDYDKMNNICRECAENYTCGVIERLNDRN